MDVLRVVDLCTIYEYLKETFSWLLSRRPVTSLVEVLSSGFFRQLSASGNIWLNYTEMSGNFIKGLRA